MSVTPTGGQLSPGVVSPRPEEQNPNDSTQPPASCPPLYIRQQRFVRFPSSGRSYNPYNRTAETDQKSFPSEMPIATGVFACPSTFLSTRSPRRHTGCFGKCRQRHQPTNGTEPSHDLG